MRPLEQQTVLVTGSTNGLGKALARELVQRGATVLLHGRSQARMAEQRGATYESIRAGALPLRPR